MKKQTSHIINRIVIIPLVFTVAYLLILNGRNDPMGLGLLYAFIATLIFIPIFLVVDTLFLSKLKNKTRINWVIVLFLFILLLVLLMDFYTN